MPMTADNLLIWRKEFPIVDTCTYLVSHSLGAMPRQGLRLSAAVRRRVVEPRRPRVARGLVGDRPDDGGSAGADAGRADGHDLDAPERHRGAWRSSHRATGSMAPRNRIVMTDLEFPSNMYLFEGFRRYGAEIVYVPSPDTMRTDLQRLLDAIDERTVLVPLSLRAVQERVHPGRGRGDREGAPRRRARRSSTSTRRPAPCRWRSSGSAPISRSAAR